MFRESCFPVCKQTSLSICLEEKQGLANELILSCNNCDFKYTTYSSQRLTENNKSHFCVNRSAVQAINALGKDYADLELFLAYLNINNMDSKAFTSRLKYISIKNYSEIRKNDRIAHVNENVALESDNLYKKG